MFAYFRGKLASLLPEEVVVEVSGIAYQLLISATTHRQLPEQGSEVLLFAHLVVREDLLQLYGFSREEERQLFRLLLLATGVGPKIALALLSGLSVRDIHEAILADSPERLYGITGVGKKTAAKIILDLRDRILKLSPASAIASSDGIPSSRLRDDAVNALVTLGFSRIMAQKAVVAIVEQTPRLTVEEVIKAALLSIHNS